MLVRVVANNVLSFGKQKEFNMLPSPKYSRMKEHKYEICGLSVLKLSAIYGANGAGKSNLVKLLALLKNIVTQESLPSDIQKTKFKLGDPAKEAGQILAIEFIQNNIIFYYAIEIFNTHIRTEELYESDPNGDKDQIIFERKTSDDGITTIKFSKKFEEDKENLVLKNVIEKSLTKPNKPILKLLTTLNNPSLVNIQQAFDWFDDSLVIINPDSKPIAIAQTLDTDRNFYNYAEDIMCSFNVGISGIGTEKKKVDEFFGENLPEGIDKFLMDLRDNPDPKKSMVGFRNQKGHEIIFVKENKDIYVKQVKLEHTAYKGKKEYFDLDEESDGTIRLLDFIPAFKDVISEKKVYIIDEIERSIHPLLIKELIKKYSEDKNTNGQLIFTTHESNLLDQNIFRQDEIWFVEKDKSGCSDLYSLSDFKEHHTLDIRKNYLNGRYGSIPFLANFQDLNWHKYDFTK